MENDLKFLKGSSTDYQNVEPKVETTFYYTTDDGKLYLGNHELTTEANIKAAVAKVATHDTDIQKLKTEISTLIGSEDGKSIHDLIEEAVNNENTTYVGDKTTLTTEAKTTIVEAINEVNANADAAQAAADAAKTEAKVTIEKTTPEGVAARYTIKQNSIAIADGTIDIPKDMVVSSGEVVVITAKDIAEDGKYYNKVDKAGTYIKLVLSDDAKTELFILVDTLVDIYKAASDEEKTKEIKVAVDNTLREISATLVDGGITSEKLANNAVTEGKIAENAVKSANIADGAITADKLAEGAVSIDSITDGTITAAKLAEDVQQNLTKANTALQANNITEGKTNGTIAVNEVDINVHGLKSLAYMDETDLSLTDYAKKTDIKEGTADGTIAVGETNVAVHNLSNMISAGVEQAKIYTDSKFVWEDIPTA